MAFLPTNATSVQAFAGALYGLQIGTGTMTQVNNDITSFGGLNNALNAYYSASFGSTATATVAANLVANIGISAANSAAAVSYVTGVLNATAANARGAAVMNILNQLASLSSDATFGADATAWNTKVAAAVAYTGAADAASGSVVNQTFTLTTGVDNVVGGAGNDTIVADNTGTTKQLTVADAINGGAGNDTLKVYLASGDTALTFPTLTSIETLYVNGGGLTAITAPTGTTALSIDGTIGVAGSATSGANTYTLAGQSLTLANSAANTTNANQAVALTTTVASTTDTTETITVSKYANTSHTGANATVYTDTNTLDLSGTKVTSLSLTSTGSSNAFTLTNTGSKLDTLTVSGDKNSTITEAISTLKTVTASALTGNLSLDTSGGTANAAFAFTGGAGADKLTLAAGALVSTQALDGGAGTDTLVLKDTAVSSSTTALNAAINKVANFEVLGFAGTAIAVDMSKVTAFTQFSTEVAITGTAGATGAPGTAGSAAAAFTGESNSQTIIFNTAETGGVGGAGQAAGNAGGAGGAAVTVAPNLDNGSNVVTVTMSGITLTGGAGGVGNGAGNSGNGGAALDLTSFESVNITSNTNAAGTSTSNALTAGAGGAASGGGGAAGTAGAGLLVGANATLTISGAAALNLGAVVSNPGQSTSNNLTLNAGNLTGNLTVVTAGGNDAITGGSGVNNITLGGGVDTVDISKSTAKADTLVFASATGTPKSGVAVTGFTNALNTGDTLDVVGTASVTTSGTATVNTGLANAVTATINAKGVASFSAVGSSAALGDYVDAVFAAINAATNKVATFVYGSDTYVVEDNGTAGAFNSGTDLVVKLVGVSGVAGLSTTASAADTILVA